MGDTVTRTLAANGITIAGTRWIWYPGWKGGIFEPHYRRDQVAVFNGLDGFIGDNPIEYGAFPGQGVNGSYCQCRTRWLLRGANGRFLGETTTYPGGTIG